MGRFKPVRITGIVILIPFLLLVIGGPLDARSSVKKAVQRKADASSHARKAKPPVAVKSATYRVRKGDTLFSIARRFHVAPPDLLSANGMTQRQVIKTGMRLKIPRQERIEKKRSVVDDKNEKSVISRAHPDFAWPVRTVESYRHDGSEGVRPLGIVIQTSSGAPVRSAASGTVQKIGYMRGFGNYIVIRHKGKYATVYAHLDTIAVEEGTDVVKGRMVGRVSDTFATLHFQIDYEGKPENPLNYLPNYK